ncbi:DUF4129 domain-containing protein [Bacillus sp. FSL K6-3431]|uniref:DUF4129 domain-containing protein n=1 Tax=Bacillus sp. FSL K6-3431 TaxID=2921500 RepID=UPI0030F833ED
MVNVDEARDELEKILNGQEYTIYRDQSKSIVKMWWVKAKEWLAEQLEKLFPSFEKTATVAEPLLIIIIAIVIIILAVVLFFIVRNMRRKRIFRDKTPLRSMKEMDWSYQMHLSEAKKQESLEKYAPATRHLFLALLLYFHEKEWLEARIWKTNWEYFEELKKVNKQSADPFFHLAHFFEEVTYGEREVQKEEYIQFHTDVMKWLGESDKSAQG